MKLPDLKGRVGWPQALLAACAVVMVLMISTGVMSGNEAKARYDSEFGVNQSSIDKIKAEIKELDVQPVLKREELADYLYAAQTAGNKVATFQTEFQNCYGSADVQSALDINYKSLMPFFDSSDGTGWSVWFVPDRKLAQEPMSWSFMTNYSIGVAEFPCVWFLEDASGELVAYATSNYSGKTGLFSGTEVHKTVYGLTKYTDYIETYDPGSSDFQQETPVDIPAGYHINETGALVNDAGEVYVAPDDDGTEVWSGGFGTDGDYSQEFAAAVDARRNGEPTGSLSDLEEEGDARFHEEEG